MPNGRSWSRFCRRHARAGASASGRCARSSTRSSTFCVAASPGGCCPRASRRLSTVYRWFARFRDDGTWETINHHLVMRDRERVGREASPTAAVIDSQSVKTTESGRSARLRCGKKVLGRKRHAMVDTDGRALKLQAHPASVQDRDGAGPLLRASRPACLSSSASLPIAATPDRASQRQPDQRRDRAQTTDQVGFAVQPRRWVVERFFAWLGRNRRLAKDFEATIASAEAFL